MKCTACFDKRQVIISEDNSKHAHFLECIEEKNGCQVLDRDTTIHILSTRLAKWSLPKKGDQISRYDVRETELSANLNPQLAKVKVSLGLDTRNNYGFSESCNEESPGFVVVESNPLKLSNYVLDKEPSILEVKIYKDQEFIGNKSLLSIDFK